MRWIRGGLNILSTILCLASAFLWMRTTLAGQTLQLVSVENGRKVTRSLLAGDGRLCYRVETTPKDWSTLPPGWHCFSVEGVFVDLTIPSYDGFMGFEAVEQVYQGRALSVPIVRAVRIGVPIWLPLVLFAVAPAYWLTHRRSFPEGCCQRCGYDLRGTPDRCPECGFATGNG
jgi:hypothetical protein